MSRTCFIVAIAAAAMFFNIRPVMGQTALGSILTTPLTSMFASNGGGLSALSPITSGSNIVGALAGNLGVGPSVKAGAATAGASSAISALTVITAFEQQMNTLKALTADVMDAQHQIATSIRANATNTALNWVLDPLQTIQDRATNIQGVIGKGLTTARNAVAGIARVAGDAVAGIPALVQTAARASGLLIQAPATVAGNVLRGSLSAVESLKAVTAKASPALAGNRALQLGLGVFNGQLTLTQASLTALLKLMDGWQGLNGSVVDAANAIVQSYIGAAGSNVNAITSTLSPLLGSFKIGSGALSSLSGLSKLLTPAAKP